MVYRKLHPRLFFSRFLPVAGVLLGLAGCAAPERGGLPRFHTVVVDAGHGGHDSGALSRPAYAPARRGKSRGRTKVRRVSGVRVAEKDLALDTALRLREKLVAGGLRVVMSREDDRFVPLDERVAISNREHHSLFVSIHFNDSRKRSIHGAEVYHNGRGTEALARRLAASLATVPGVASRGTAQARFRVLRNSNGPAVLVEGGYLSHSAEAARCASPAHRQQLADAVARTLLEARDQPRGGRR